MASKRLVAALEAMWCDVAPNLRGHSDALALVAFRLLVYFLELDGFFLRGVQVIENAQTASKISLKVHAFISLWPGDGDAFIRAVGDLLTAPDAATIAQVVFGMDEKLGKDLELLLRQKHDAGGMGAYTPAEDAINLANRTLLCVLGIDRVVLLRTLKPYWKSIENRVGPFHQAPQHLTCYFRHLRPGIMKLSALEYSHLQGPLTLGNKKCKIVLWPTKIASIESWYETSPSLDGKLFRFKRWANLEHHVKQEHETLVNNISSYITDEQDMSGRTYIVAAPELALAPEALAGIRAAVATRRNSNWIIFPGTYHIDHGSDVINLGHIFVGGRLDEKYLTRGDHGHVAAIKRTAFVVSYDGTLLKENIAGTASSVHVLDTDAGRIAVMICRDFLEEDIRHDVAMLDLDHLFVLSMSPDTGQKFKRAMDAVSDLGVGSFFVNAAIDNEKRIYAGYRKPINRTKVKVRNEMRTPNGQPYVYTLQIKD